jgi:hypothetical protein
MALSNDDLYDKALDLSKDFDDNFLDLAKTLRQLLDRDPEKFRDLWTKTNIGRRKAYYLVEVSRVFDSLPAPRSRLKKIGWTKLQIIGKHVTKDNLGEMLELAEQHTAKELESLMRGEKPSNNAHCVLMYFSPKQYDLLERVLLKNGGQRSGRGILDKEEALITALKKLESAEKGG